MSRNTKHVCLLIAATISVALIVHAFVLHPVPQRKLERLNKSMTQAEVLDLLGKPARKVGPSNVVWLYKTPFRLGYVLVYFQSSAGDFHSYEYEQ